MAGMPKWNELTAWQRVLVILGALVDTTAKAVALRDLRRRPAAEVRGPKWIWATAITLTGSLGSVPLAYLLVGRRRS